MAMGTMNIERGRRNAAWKRKKTWRSEYDWQSLSLSPTMQNGLKQLVIQGQSRINPIPSKTSDALQRRSLVDSAGAPTDPGIIAGLSCAALWQQCQFLGIEVEKIELQKKYDDPAVDGMYYFANRGNRCCYSEGAVLRKILYCLYFHRLAELTKEGWKHYMEGVSTYPLAVGLNLFDFEAYVKDYYTIESDLVETVLEADLKIFLANYRKLFKKGFCWFGADEAFASQVFSYLGPERLAGILRAFLTDRYAFSKGWPDLMVIKDGSVEFVEVKTNDRLIISQLITIPALIGTGGLTVKVLRISRSKHICKAVCS